MSTFLPTRIKPSSSRTARTWRTAWRSPMTNDQATRKLHVSILVSFTAESACRCSMILTMPRQPGEMSNSARTPHGAGMIARGVMLGDFT
jgi:hypothetical protein